jgi:hypothetical protein
MSKHSLDYESYPIADTFRGTHREKRKRNFAYPKLKAISWSLEARAGIEPAHKGFADLSLTTWVPRLGRAVLIMGSKSP